MSIYLKASIETLYVTYQKQKTPYCQKNERDEGVYCDAFLKEVFITIKHNIKLLMIKVSILTMISLHFSLDKHSCLFFHQNHLNVLV
jgi:hypothetical protein